MKRKQILTAVMAAIILLILGACQVEQQPSKIGSLGTADQQTPSNSGQLPEETIYEIGDIISINDTVLVVLGWDQPPGGDFNPPDEGKKYLVVEQV